ncbi:hypothetical protein DBV15_09771 [Temnothorax longispinosus]|uniref:Uncharacterized protein n=1 Tax=Temnothorax longispinosus TaxID=300112 RepID=A0A4S2KN45_9HYME|nr:hypothetical protein DBV15_09771 [Temnothorax longispinosus]
MSEARTNRAHGHRCRRKVTDVHVEFGGHREDAAGSISDEGHRSSRDNPVQLAEGVALEEAKRETRVFSQYSKSWMRTWLPRMSLPKAWGGLENDALEEACGIEGALFVLSDRCRGGHKTKDGAVAMARKALEIGKTVQS